jgi:hypothetical protein
LWWPFFPLKRDFFSLIFISTSHQLRLNEWEWTCKNLKNLFKTRKSRKKGRRKYSQNLKLTLPIYFSLQFTKEQRWEWKWNKWVSLTFLENITLDFNLSVYPKIRKLEWREKSSRYHKFRWKNINVRLSEWTFRWARSKILIFMTFLSFSLLCIRMRE